jgi:hypothetical protein
MKRRRTLDFTVAKRLRETARRWKWLLFWRLASSVAIAAALGALALGGAMSVGWVASTVVATMWAVVIFLFAVVGFGAVAIIAAVQNRPHSWLARQIENRRPHLLDRLNAVTFLEGRRRDAHADDFYHAIGQQAGEQLLGRRPLRAVPGGVTLCWVIAAILVCVGTREYYVHFRPWEHMREKLAVLAALPTDSAELKLPEADDATEVRDTWGEVRITEPGGDLKLTKVDVLPLTIEAASSQRLQQASWTTGVNGADAVVRPLEKPQEPNYGAYQPALYLDELGLSDWDVLSYYAAASTDAGSHYASEIYFVEVRPFREEMLKLQGGGGGGGGQCLNRLGLLIQKQQNILRQTHRQDQVPATNDTQREQDQTKLAEAQEDLRKATDHLYAEIAEKMEEQGVGTVLDQLALAEGTMGEAVAKLREPDNPKAKDRERSALQQLVESRKDFVKLLKQGGGKGDGGESSGGDEQQPVAGLEKPPEDQLSDIEDFRDLSKAALAAVAEARKTEEAIAGGAAGARATRLKRQREMERKFSDFQKKTPGPFQGVKKETAAANDAISKAEYALETGYFMGEATKKAAEELAKLEQALGRSLERHSLADVYRIKQLLADSKADIERQLAQQQGQQGQGTAQQLARAGRQAKVAKDALAEALVKTPAGKAFGPTLEEAVKGEPGRELDQAAQQMQQGGNVAAAGAMKAGESLEKIARAFDASAPAMLHGESSPQGESSGADVASRLLASLLKRLGDGRPASPEDTRKQLEEAREALAAEAKEHPETAPMLVKVTKDLEAMNKVDLNVNEAALHKLMDKLESARIELAASPDEKAVDPQLLKADPAKAPTEFRERVRRYFEKLSDG